MACKVKAAKRYNTKVKQRRFHPEDLVWRARGNARKEKGEGKFSSNWEGPFRITEDLKNGACRLEYLSEKEIPRTWNANLLKFYFS